MTTPTVSIVVPSFGCVGSLVELITRVRSALEGVGCTYEIVIVDDRSTDGSWDLTRDWAGRHGVRAVRLSRNFGQQAAIAAGLDLARGETIVVMDCDLQDPPELIPTLIEPLDKGADVVFTRRIGDYDGALRRILGRAYFRVFRFLSGIEVDPRQGSFTAMNRKAADAARRLREPDRHYLFVLRWIGFNAAIVDYQREARPTGASSYTLARRMRLALSGLAFDSSRLLFFLLCFGFLIVIVAAFFALGAIFLALVGHSPPGWMSVFLAVVLGTGIITTIVAVVGLYVARTFELVKRRPVYLLDSDLPEKTKAGC